MSVQLSEIMNTMNANFALGSVAVDERPRLCREASQRGSGLVTPYEARLVPWPDRSRREPTVFHRRVRQREACM